MVAYCRSYIVPEERLLELLEAEARLHCLEQDGVDNWQWYMESHDQFVADCLGLPKMMIEEEGLSFNHVAVAALDDFQEF